MYTSTEKFMAMQIIQGRGKYQEVVTARPDLKEGIETYLNEVSRTDLIVAV